ncbi:hypothetical protein I7I50_03258 [Histoplasma capsulatum G186AR]|uniref:Uncharacterized protein n=1 Tax=Ajellomyces capsulatus TaxID=5037 RepID=A0A8H8D5G8_AJECA|nr:hypothetical protein I7I52_00073 [Histoplasma capsulatum]QSS72170.1 hypothetical protein I7I50_03258 [Histoplasma capsulatum G186AR]
MIHVWLSTRSTYSQHTCTNISCSVISSLIDFFFCVLELVETIVLDFESLVWWFSFGSRS